MITFPDYYGLYTSADSKIFTIIVNLNLIVVTYNKLMCKALFYFLFRFNFSEIKDLLAS